MAEAVIDPAKRVMYVTMGTSLFHSATWEATEEVRTLVPGYEEWTEEDCRRSPYARLTSGLASSISERLQCILRTTNADQWAKWLPADLLQGTPVPGNWLRYSAELTTLLRFAHRPASRNLADFLNEYAEIRFVYDSRSPESGGPNLPQIAASHLAHYLDLLAGHENRAKLVPIAGLSSRNPEEVLTGLQGFGKEIAQAIEAHRYFDFIASGGFKLYGPFLADLRRIPSISARLIYLHEDGSGIFVSPREAREPLPLTGHEAEQIQESAVDFNVY